MNVSTADFRRYFFAGVLLMGSASCVWASAPEPLTGPDGKLKVDVTVNDGRPEYSVSYAGKDFIVSSPLGYVSDTGDFTRGLTLSEAAAPEAVADSYSLPNIKRSHVDYKANRRTYSFTKDGKRAFDLILQVGDHDVAMRYRIYPQGDKLAAVIEEEGTSFRFPEGTTLYMCPQSHPMGGFARTAPSYETDYEVGEAYGRNGYGEGYTFPCLFKVGDQGWALVSETGVDGGYCASRLVWDPDRGAYRVGYPQKGEMNGLGSEKPGLALPSETPWRTITVGEDLAPIVETTVPFDVVSPKYKASKDYEYTKGTWSWIMKMDPSCNFDEQKRYIDFSAAMGYGTVLVDALWDTQIGYDKIGELAEYGRGKGVDLYLWYNSNGYWNDAPQGPRGIMDNSRKRRAEMDWMRKNGIKGIKVDFFGGDKQEMMRLYEDILTDANDYGIMVIFHGCTLPRGWERMYPNYASSEAVLASENLHFSQGRCDREAYDATIHPFVRNTVGSMDFGGSALNRYWNATNTPGGNVKRTSDVFSLATAVLYQSGVQHFALAPNNLNDAPEWAIDFMKGVPTTWDDVRYIAGEPGKYVVLARRKGDTWYYAGVNGLKQPVELTIDLIPDGKGEGTLYSDSKTLEGSVKNVKIKKDRLKVSMPENGGFVLIR